MVTAEVSTMFQCSMSLSRHVTNVIIHSSTKRLHMDWSGGPNVAERGFMWLKVAS
jgi:hypothetical protein